MKNAFVCLALCGALAVQLCSLASAEEGQDEKLIRQLLVQAFDKPDAPLMVDPIVSQDDAAIADWTQNELGGRALLRRKGESWEIILCAGDAIKEPAALEKTGIEKTKAEALAAKLSLAEQTISPSRLALFSRFDGVVMMGPNGDSPSDRHHGVGP